MNIDLNRGVTMKMHPASGVRIYMYKDAPGVFLNAHGHEVADTLASQCGFQIKELKKQREKREALAQAATEIEAQFASEQANQNAGKVIKEKNGYKIVKYIFGRCWVYGPDGEKMHDKPQTQQEARHLFKVLCESPTPDGEPAAETETDSEGDGDGP